MPKDKNTEPEKIADGIICLATGLSIAYKENDLKFMKSRGIMKMKSQTGNITENQNIIISKDKIKAMSEKPLHSKESLVTKSIQNINHFTNLSRTIYFNDIKRIWDKDDITYEDLLNSHIDSIPVDDNYLESIGNISLDKMNDEILEKCIKENELISVYVNGKFDGYRSVFEKVDE